MLLFGFWTALGIFFSVQSVLTYTNQGREVTWTAPLIYQLGYWYTWALMLPSITWIVHRNPLDDRRRKQSIVRVVAATIIIAPVQFVIASLIRLSGLYVFSVIDAERYSAMLSSIRGQVLTSSFDSALTYWTIAGIIYAYYYYRALKEREVSSSRLETSLAEARLNNLRAQIQPHFLFNTLNSISALVTQDAAGAEKMIARLSELLRLSLDGSRKKTVSVRSELAFVGRYLEIEQTRFQDRLSISIDFETGIAECDMPPILLQPLVENAIIHGIAPYESDGSIDVRAFGTENILVFTITDSGAGFDESASGFREGIGIKNVRSRLEQLYGRRASLQFIFPEEGGFEARVSIPLMDDKQ